MCPGLGGEDAPSAAHRPLSPDLVGQLHTFPVLHGPLVQLQHGVQLLQACSLGWAPCKDKEKSLEPSASPATVGKEGPFSLRLL